MRLNGRNQFIFAFIVASQLGINSKTILGAEAEIEPERQESKSNLIGGNSDYVLRTREERRISRSRVSLGPFYYVLKNEDDVVSGVGISGGMRYRASNRISVSGGLRQGFSRGTGLTTLFTSLDAALEFQFAEEVGGSFYDLKLDDKEIVSYATNYSGGWKCAVGVSQYFLNTAFSAVPFSGFTLATYYEFPGMSLGGLEFGVQVERISNGRRSIQPLSLVSRFLIGSNTRD